MKNGQLRQNYSKQQHRNAELGFIPPTLEQESHHQGMRGSDFGSITAKVDRYFTEFVLYHEMIAFLFY